MSVLPRGMRDAPNLDEFAGLAQVALRAIPSAFSRRLENVVIKVAEQCDKDIERELGLDSPLDLLGLYHGVSLDRRGFCDTTEDVDTIFLYRLPILRYWDQGHDDLTNIIRHVLIHEVGHHFGLSDEDMRRIEEEE